MPGVWIITYLILMCNDGDYVLLPDILILQRFTCLILLNSSTLLDRTEWCIEFITALLAILIRNVLGFLKLYTIRVL